MRCDVDNLKIGQWFGLESFRCLSRGFHRPQAAQNMELAFVGAKSSETCEILPQGWLSHQMKRLDYWFAVLNF